MKRILFGFACAAAASAAMADVYTWTGAGDGVNWSDAANWEKTASDNTKTVRFTNGVSVAVDDMAAGSFWPNTIKVEAGDVYLCNGGRGRHYLMDSPVIDVAKDARLVTSNQFDYYNFGTFTKKGEGTFALARCSIAGGVGNTSPSARDGCVWSPVTVAEGTMEMVDGVTIGTSNVVVKAGATLATSGTDGTASVSPARLRLEEGATLRVGHKVFVGGLDGAGDLVAADGVSVLDAIVEVVCVAPNCTFTGNVGTNLQFVFDGGVCPFVAQRADLLKDAIVSAGEGLRFKSGAGEFAVGQFYGSSGRHFWLQDETGGVVSVSAGLANYGNLNFDGPGNLTVVTNSVTPNGSVTVYGNSYRATGEVRAGEGVRLQLGCNSSAHDLDYSGAGVKAVRCSGGTLTFNQYVQADVAVPVTGTGRLDMAGRGAKLRDLDFVSPGLDGNATALSNPFELAGGRLVASVVIGGCWPIEKKGVHTVSGGLLGGPSAAIPYSTSLNSAAKTYRQYPTGVHTYGYSGWFSFQVTGGEFWWRTGNALKNLFLRGGRAFADAGASMSTTPNALADGGPAQFVFDGGDLTLCDRDGSGNCFALLEESGNANVVYVGERGGRIRAWNPFSQYGGRIFQIYAPVCTCTNVVADGGLEFVGAGVFTFAHPMQINGPVRVLDGRVSIAPKMLDESCAPFGTGDFVLRNSCLTWNDGWTAGMTTNVVVAGGASSAFEFNGGAAVRFRWDGGTKYAPQRLRARALRRGGKGSVLFIRMEGDDDVLGETSSFKLDVAPEATVAGNVALPVLVARQFGYEFLKYDAEKGFVPFDDYVDSISAASAGKVVKIAGGGASVGDDAAALGVRVCGSWGTISIASGKTLTLGDGVNPAVVTMGVAGNVGGAGTLDFGGSEGVFLPNNTTGVPGSHTVSCRLAGTAGVSFVAPAVSAHDYKFILTSANAHLGGTYVDGVRVVARNLGCFGAGDVVIGGGTTYGGVVTLDAAGTWTNDFRVAGFGVGARSQSVPTALDFNAACDVAGKIEIVEPARFSVASGVSATISGVVSGDRLQVCDSSIYFGAAHDGTLTLTGANVHTGGTEIVKATLAVTLAEGVGTGVVTLDDGTLKFVNDAPITFTNAVEGVGRIVLAGSAPVTFAGKSFDALPIKTLAPGSALAFPALADSDLVAWVDAENGLDLGGRNLTVGGICGVGRVFGGELTVTGEINPGGAGAIGSLAFDVAPVLDGATYVCDLIGGESDSLALPGAFDLSALNFRAALGSDFAATRCTALTAASVSGAFNSAALPAGRWKVVVGADKADVVHNLGTALIVR